MLLHSWDLQGLTPNNSSKVCKLLCLSRAFTGLMVFDLILTMIRRRKPVNIVTLIFQRKKLREISQSPRKREVLGKEKERKKKKKLRLR